MTLLRPRSIDELIAPYAPAVRRLAHAARRRIMALVPDATEKLRPGWGLIGYNAPSYFAFVAPLADHVRIGFEWGVELPDPFKLLDGSGAQVRHLSIRKTADLRGARFADLVRAAAALPPPRRR